MIWRIDIPMDRLVTKRRASMLYRNGLEEEFHWPTATTVPCRGLMTLMRRSLQVLANREPVRFQEMDRMTSGWRLMEWTTDADAVFQTMHWKQIIFVIESLELKFRSNYMCISITHRLHRSTRKLSLTMINIMINTPTAIGPKPIIIRTGLWMYSWNS